MVNQCVMAFNEIHLARTFIHCLNFWSHS